MADKLENNESFQNYVELTESQIFEKIKKDLYPIQENLSEKKITVDEAKGELKKINEWIQWTKIEIKDKKEIWKAFEKLSKLERNIDENTLKNEVEEITKLLDNLIQKDLASLKKNIIQKHTPWQTERKPEVQQWIDLASNNLEKTIHEASQDKNPIANRVWKAMEWLNS